jgi:glycosyltransferase involved in cell wall biosynthesis
MIQNAPFVSVLTPVFNGERYLAERIESVLMQTYRNFEYIIVNNCSTDHTLEIALSYAKKDSRVQVHTNKSFVNVIENHNIAFRSISPESKYCKVVSADDWLFPDCLTRLVELAEENPSVGFVGSYQLNGSIIKWQGFEYPMSVMPGREMCRRMFLGDDKSFGSGAPTSLLYRADIVRKSGAFYPNSSPHADTSATFKYLQDSDFGFVYQVLSYERTHGDTQTSKSKEINRYLSAYLNDLIQYGPSYLSEEEYERKLKEDLDSYYRYLAVNILAFRGLEFWNYHKSRLEELGYPIRPSKLLKAGIIMVLREMMNPEQAIRKFRRYYFRKSEE